MARPLPWIRPNYKDSSGPLAGGLLYTYEANTDTPLATYTDASEETENANPVVFDANGEADVWLGNGVYRLVLKNSAGVTQWDRDNILGDLGGVSTGNKTVTEIEVDFSTDPVLPVVQTDILVVEADGGVGQGVGNVTFPEQEDEGDNGKQIWIYCFPQQHQAEVYVDVDNADQEFQMTKKGLYIWEWIDGNWYPISFSEYPRSHRWTKSIGQLNIPFFLKFLATNSEPTLPTTVDIFQYASCRDQQNLRVKMRLGWTDPTGGANGSGVYVFDLMRPFLDGEGEGGGGDAVDGGQFCQVDTDGLVVSEYSPGSGGDEADEMTMGHIGTGQAVIGGVSYNARVMVKDFGGGTGPIGLSILLQAGDVPDAWFPMGSASAQKFFTEAAELNVEFEIPIHEWNDFTGG